MRFQLYLHFPFCKRKCAYCDFYSGPAPAEEIRAYCDALCAEIRRQGEIWRGAAVDTVFLGGGTPSIVPPEELDRVLAALEENFSISRDAEFTSEANPGTLTLPWLEVLAAHGGNRLSLGVQAVQDRLLKSLGRIHTFGEAMEAFSLARRAGFHNLNADLMFALPGQTLSDWRDAIEGGCALEPAHISAYSLIVEEGTPLGRAAEAGEITVPDEDAAAEMYLQGREELGKRGYAQYEISNFARPGYTCRHNIGYWQGAWYLGLGASAHSMLPPDAVRAEQGILRVRKANHNDRREYIRALWEERPVPCETDFIRGKEAMFETMMLGLRMNEGVNAQAFHSQFGQTLAQAYGNRLDSLVRDGLAFWSPEGCFALTERGMLLQNQALLRLMDA